MAILFIDGFDHYTTITDKWPTFGTASIGAFGRNGNGMRLTTYNSFARRGFASSGTVLFGFAYRNSVTSPSQLQPIISLMTNGVANAGIWVTTGGKLTWGTGAAGTQRAIGSFTFSNSVWYYVEVKVVLATGATGTIQVAVNGVDDINTSSVITASASTTVNGMSLCQAPGNSTSASWNLDIDDLYIASSGSLLGDCKVETLYPSGAGNSTQFTPSTGSNYAAVDETPQDGDTTYVESSTVSQKDTYAYADLTTTSGTVYAVQPNLIARKTDAGTRSVVSVARLSATEVDSSAVALGLEYVAYPDIRETKPGGGAWAISDVNSSEFGVKVSA